MNASDCRETKKISGGDGWGMKTADWDVGREVLCFICCGHATFQAMDIFLASKIADKEIWKQKEEDYIKMPHYVRIPAASVARKLISTI